MGLVKRFPNFVKDRWFSKKAQNADTSDVREAADKGPAGPNNTTVAPDIHINRGGQSFGPYPEDVARQRLGTGSLLPTDLAWHEGADRWKPLREVLAIEYKSERLNKVIGMGVIYLIASDGRISRGEQEWYDKKFGENSSETLITLVQAIDWDKFYSEIEREVSLLSREEREYLWEAADDMFIQALRADRMTPKEKESYDHFVSYLRSVIK